MPPKRSDKKAPPTSASGTTSDTTPKPSRTAWKTGEQLEYMLSHWADFVTHQTQGSLDRFWPHVYDGWYTQWPIKPTPESISKAGNRECAILTLRSENNNVRIMNPSPNTPDHSYPFVRESVRGFTTTPVPPPRLLSRTCGLIKMRGERLLPSKLIALTPGIWAFGQRLRANGNRKRSPICQRTRTTLPPIQLRRLTPIPTSPSISNSGLQRRPTTN